MTSAARTPSTDAFTNCASACCRGMVRPWSMPFPCALFGSDYLSADKISNRGGKQDISLI